MHGADVFVPARGDTMQKCKSCGACWDAKRSDRCPFCGSDLIEKKDIDTIGEAFSLIYKNHGPEVFQSRVLLGFLGDYAPLLTRERKLIKTAIECGAYPEICTSEISDLPRIAARYASVLTEEYFFDEAWAKAVISWLVDLRNSVEKNELMQEQQPDGTKNQPQNPLSETMNAADQARLTRLTARTAMPGEILTLGRYDQGNGCAPIVWQVLNRKQNRLLLVSKYGLDCMPYHERLEFVRWEDCSLRTWLNEIFLETAFCAEERGLIAASGVSSSGVSSGVSFSGVSSGVSSERTASDLLFLLSIQEVKRYFPTANDRQCLPSPYAGSRGTGTDPVSGSCWWWLRSREASSFFAPCITPGGTLYQPGSNVNFNGCAVRPALWIDPDA